MNDIKRLVLSIASKNKIKQINIEYRNKYKYVYMKYTDGYHGGLLHTCMTKIYNYRRWCSNVSPYWNNLMIYTLKHTESVGVIPINY